jgi:UDP-N-acetylglucosamine--N-acetylmuramyl-(pentapeptide) pyrophosphoryl-undecaprenol N-acetylglucosamine transferase
VRQDIKDVDQKRAEGQSFFNLDPSKKTLLIVGGSLGAKGINEAIGEGLQQLADNNIQVIWQTGKLYFEKAKQQTAPYTSKNIQALDFISRMDLAYAVADCVVSRAGAGAVSELCIVKRPAILVPLLTAAEDHQTMNAMSLVNKNAAILVRDDAPKNKLVNEAITLMKDEARQNELKKNIGSLALLNSANVIAKEVLRLANYKP